MTHIIIKIDPNICLQLFSNALLYLLEFGVDLLSVKLIRFRCFELACDMITENINHYSSVYSINNNYETLDLLFLCVDYDKTHLQLPIV